MASGLVLAKILDDDDGIFSVFDSNSCVIGTYG